MDTVPSGPYATIQQFAAKHQVSTKTVQRWLKLGLPSYAVGKVRRIFVHEAEQWVYHHSTKKAATQRSDPEAAVIPKNLMLSLALHRDARIAALRRRCTGDLLTPAR
jgi:hypothetical protein